MTSGRTKQILGQQGKQIAILKGRMKLGEFMGLPEDDFEKLIKKIKNNPLFRRLAAPEAKIITCKRFPGTSLARFKTIPLDPAITPSQDSFDLESFLSQEKEVTLAIKNLGVDKFKEYFLDRVPGITLEEIATRCDLTIEEVEKINDFTNRFYLQANSSGASRGEKISRIYYFTIASVEKEKGGFSIGFFTDKIVEGRYIINFERLEEVKKKGEFNKSEIKKIKVLFDKLRLINSRKTIIYRVIQNIIEVQCDFLNSGNFRDLKVLTQASLAEKIGVEASLISRAISGKAVRIPQGREISLKTFFPSKKQIRKELLRQIIEQEKTELQNKVIKKPYSDGEIRDKLKEDYGISISRRSVSEWRIGLMIPPASKRIGQWNTG